MRGGRTSQTLSPVTLTRNSGRTVIPVIGTAFGIKLATLKFFGHGEMELALGLILHVSSRQLVFLAAQSHW